jgi:uncharacterized protein YndB with AHSA1/START domain
MKVVKLVGLVLLLLVLVGLFLPTTYDISRSITIDAPAARVHEWVGDLARWPEWTPWAEHDPTLQVTNGPQTTGIGAQQSWTGAEGGGKLTFTRCSPTEGIAYDMAFIHEGEDLPSKSAMLYREEGGATTVTWTLQGDGADFLPPVVGGWMNLFMKGAINAEFDKGLAKLKQVVEAAGQG